MYEMAQVKQNTSDIYLQMPLLALDSL